MTPTPMTSASGQITWPRFRRLVFVLPLLAFANFGCAKEEENKEQHLSRAHDYLAAEQYDKAEKEYREVLLRTKSLGQI